MYYIIAVYIKSYVIEPVYNFMTSIVTRGCDVEYLKSMMSIMVSEYKLNSWLVSGNHVYDETEERDEMEDVSPIQDSNGDESNDYDSHDNNCKGDTNNCLDESSSSDEDTC